MNKWAGDKIRIAEEGKNEVLRTNNIYESSEEDTTMSELFLLGAGASIEADVPAAFEMTKKMLNAIESLQGKQECTHMLRFIVGGLMFQKGTRGEDPISGVNIEDLFNAVNELVNRDTTSLAPFIGSWHPLLDQFKSNKPTSSDYSSLLASITVNGSSSSFEDAFEKIIYKLTSSGSKQILNETSELMIRRLIKMVWIQEAGKVEYLYPLLRFSSEMKSTIATLNYDNSIELAGKNLNLEVDSGLESWLSKESFRFDHKKIPLIKLHGSIDWESTKVTDKNAFPLDYFKVVKREIRDVNTVDFDPMVVFGGKNKLTTKGPFLELLRAFESKLRVSRNLVVIGYSFGDEHINDLIKKWFLQSLHRRIIIIDPKLPNSNNDFFRKLHQLVGGRVKHYKLRTSEALKNIEALLPR
jgi:hypothetical protein